MSWEYPIFICGELVNEDNPIYLLGGFSPYLSEQ